MNWPWVLGTIVFIAWFAVLESYAFAHPDKLNTLSRSVSTLGARWPFSIFLFGFVAGALASHFFWSWPANPLAGGG